MEKKNSKIKPRILQYADLKGISKRQIYRETGMSNGVLDKPTGLSEDGVDKFLKTYLDVNPLWLITGKGNMLLKDNIEPNSVYKLKTDNTITSQSVPLYDIEAVAGLVPLFNSDNKNEPIDHISIPNLPKCDGAIHVTGDSMYPLLKSGDIIMYKEIIDIENDIFFGEMYLLSLKSAGEEYITVKFIQRSEKGEEYIKLVSQNKHHGEKDIKISKIIALALVKASVRINSMS